MRRGRHAACLHAATRGEGEEGGGDGRGEAKEKGAQAARREEREGGGAETRDVNACAVVGGTVKQIQADREGAQIERATAAAAREIEECSATPLPDTHKKKSGTRRSTQSDSVRRVTMAERMR